MNIQPTHGDGALQPDSASTSKSGSDSEVLSELPEELVAYLDGELDQAAADDVERRLADDPSYHAQLLKFQKTWDMLDLLPRGESSEDFTRSTVELVTRSLEQEVNVRRRRDWGAPPRCWAGCWQ